MKDGVGWGGVGWGGGARVIERRIHRLHFFKTVHGTSNSAAHTDFAHLRARKLS